MQDENVELQARYHVVTLLYRGKLDAARTALDTYAGEKILSPHDEAFYRLLLAHALEEKPGASAQG
ncbi:MAG TPA: hypothetical protein VHY09_02010 [Candidatus Methylacidiphilales bacterium]|jgi:hypothetical protein|nr:hypothetical protein [Candidatus Methylacidiphilales bacterium]